MGKGGVLWTTNNLALCITHVLADEVCMLYTGICSHFVSKKKSSLLDSKITQWCYSKHSKYGWSGDLLIAYVIKIK